LGKVTKAAAGTAKAAAAETGNLELLPLIDGLAKRAGDGAQQVTNNKSGEFLLVFFVLLTGYLYVSGKLESVWMAATGQGRNLPPGAAPGGTNMGGVAPAVPGVTSPFPGAATPGVPVVPPGGGRIGGVPVLPPAGAPGPVPGPSGGAAGPNAGNGPGGVGTAAPPGGIRWRAWANNPNFLEVQIGRAPYNPQGRDTFVVVQPGDHFCFVAARQALGEAGYNDVDTATKAAYICGLAAIQPGVFMP
jgi:hypothetical protein